MGSLPAEWQPYVDKLEAQLETEIEMSRKLCVENKLFMESITGLNRDNRKAEATIAELKAEYEKLWEIHRQSQATPQESE